MTNIIKRSRTKSLAKTLLVSVAFFGLIACSSPEEVKQNHLENGMELLEEKDYVKASIEFRNALQIDDRFVPAWYGMSLVEDHNEEWGKVIVLLRKVVELEPTHLDAQVRLGTMMMMIGQLDTAVEVSDTALLLDNQNAEVLALKAAVLLKLDDNESAIEFANKALTIEPGNISAVQVLAAERFTKRDFDGALSYINQSNVDISQSKDLLLISILIYETKGDVEKAEESFRQLIEAFPDDQEVRTAFVRFYVTHENVDAAEAEIRKIAERDPTNFEKNIDVVRFLNTYRGGAAAEEELTSLIQRGTDVVRFQLALSDFHLINGDRDKATDMLEKIVDRTGSSEDGLIARGKLAEMALSNGEIERASEIVEQILEIDAVNVSALEMRGSIFLQQNEYDKAIQDLRIVLSESPESVRGSLLLSRAYELTGSIELADDTLADAVRFSENDESVSISYANFLLKQNAPERAEDLVVTALNSQPNSLPLLRSLAQIRLVRQDWMGAQQVADAITQMEGGENISAEISGMVSAGQSDFDQSISAFRDVYNQASVKNRPLASLIGAYIRAGKIDEAETFLNGLLSENENNYQALLLLGQIHMNNSKNDDAIALFEKAISIEPESDPAFMNLASFYIGQNDLDAAKNALDRGFESVDNKARLQMVKANIYERERDFEGAIRVYEEMYAENAVTDIVVNNLASLLSEHRSDAASMDRALELAVRFRQSVIPHFKDTLGWIYYKTGDIQAATSVLQDVVEQLPTNVHFRYHLGMSYMAGQRDAAAAREFEEVIKLAEEQQFDQLEEVKELLADMNSAN